MAYWAWIVCLASVAAAIGSAAVGLVRGARAGRARLVTHRLASPTVYLFAAYLLVAALVTPRSAGETVSPLYGLAVVLPASWALASLASIADAQARGPSAIARALVHGCSVIGAAAIVLAIASPAFVPMWLK